MNESLREHYRKLLGLEKPWEVVAVDLAMEAKRVERSDWFMGRALVSVARSVAKSAGSMTRRPSGNGGTSIQCSLRPCSAPGFPGRIVQSAA